MSERYKRNKSSINEEEQYLLSEKKVCIIGCGGLGAYISEMLCRIGIVNLVLVDYDVIEESNLNRQIIALNNNLGQSKVDELAKRCLNINPDINLKIIKEAFSTHNAHEILNGVDLVMDALDNIKCRKQLQNECEVLGIPFIHGAIAGFIGQVAFIAPGDRSLDKIYPDSDLNTLENLVGNPSFTPANIASIQVAEAIKYFLSKGELLRKKILLINLLDNEYQIFNL